MTLSHILMALAGAALGTGACGLLKTYPDKRSIVVLLVIAALGSAGAGVAAVGPKPDSSHQPATVRPLPDPDDCVQLGWLDGAWRCIPAEQAG